MARGAASPAPNPLPKVSFFRVQDNVSSHPAGVHDLQARSYGYNDFSSFQRPEHYIRYIEPLESELAVQVEYDMDEQDQEWLDTINNERKKDQLDRVSYEVFEIIMDRLEKEWFDLTKNIPKPDMALPSEDSTCAICDDSEGENTNAIVFCDGCNLAVHQDCYGVPYIPEGQWLCRKCTVSPENPVSCILCPNEGGAFKQTVNGDWVHLLCAIWVPETRVANDVFMEPITGVEKISKQRWKLKCSICDIRQGACIQCTKASCFLAFHATCARKEKLLMPMKATHGSEAPTLACYCEKHLPKEQFEARAAALAMEDTDGTANGHGHSASKSSKVARAYAKTYTTGPPLVPIVIVERVLTYIGRVNMRQKREFVLLVCRYWSLKREARRGASLLKRLHLEPWTASASGRQQTEDEKTMKLEYLKRLRQDLWRLRTLAELTHKREAQKRQQAEIIQDVVSQFLLAHEAPLRTAFDKIISLDRQDYFKNPVSKVDVPDYYDIIKRPMCWNTVDRKLDDHEYLDLKVFEDDVYLVLDNAMTYNKPGTVIYKAAQRIKSAAEPIMSDLKKRIPLSQSETPPSLIGDLEPPLYLVNLLDSQEAIRDELELVLHSAPLESLFAYEFGELKPPPPPPPPKQKPKKKGAAASKKRDRRVEAEQRKLRLSAGMAGADIDKAPGFRATTRSTRAAAAALEAELAGQGQGQEEQDGQAEAGPSRAPEVGRAERSEGAGEDGIPPRKKARRMPTAEVGHVHAHEPQLVADVNDIDSFKLFNDGWILPPDQKRGGRTPAERKAPLTTKKSKAGSQKSRLSTFSLGAADNETPHQRGHDPLPTTTMDVPMNVDHVVADTKHAQTSDPMTGVNQIISEAPGRFVILELDTPATRREKSVRKKTEREQARMKQESEAAARHRSLRDREGTDVPNAEDPGGSHREEDGPEAEDEMNSELTSLSDLSASEEDVEMSDLRPVEAPSGSGTRTEGNVQETPTAGPSKRSGRKTETDAARGDVGLPNGTSLEGGTLVWARSASYPWWPAVIFEPDDPEVPPDVLKARDAKRTQGELHLVRFYDHGKTWSWLELSRLKMLGEDPALDNDMLAAPSPYQRWKTPKIRNDCRNAYRQAMEEAEVDPNVGGPSTMEPNPADMQTGSRDRAVRTLRSSPKKG